MILDKNASIARLTPDSNDSDKEAYVTLDGLGNIAIGSPQPASAEVVALTDGVFGQTFVSHTPVSGMKIGDRMTVSGGLTYIIKGMRDWHFGAIPHLELILFEGDN